jgi:hypothetical protein
MPAVSSAGAIIGYGSDFQRSTDGTTYNTVGKVLEITAPKSKVKDIQMTNLLSPLGWHEFRAGLRDPGECSFKILFFKSDFNTIFTTDFSQVGIGASSLTSATRYWKTLFSDQTNTTPSQFICQGYINTFGTPMPLDDLVMADCTIHATGPVTFTQAN